MLKQSNQKIPYKYIDLQCTINTSSQLCTSIFGSFGQVAISVYVFGLHCHSPVSSSSMSVHSAPGHMVNVSEYMWQKYWLTSPIDAHHVILAYGIYMVFEGHICL